MKPARSAARTKVEQPHPGSGSEVRHLLPDRACKPIGVRSEEHCVRPLGGKRRVDEQLVSQCRETNIAAELVARDRKRPGRFQMPAGCPEDHRRKRAGSSRRCRAASWTDSPDAQGRGDGSAA